MRFLITGFAPFGGSQINPSYEAARLLPDTLGRHEIFRERIPVEYGKCTEALIGAIEKYRPDCVLCLGQAAGRDVISLENTAVNVRASAMPDNAGVICENDTVEAGAPESLSPNLPLKEMLSALKEIGIPAKISYSAGTYVCNDLFYSLLRYIGKERPRLLGGFIHIPATDAQAADFPAGTPTMPLSEAVRAIGTVIAVIGESYKGTDTIDGLK